MYNVYATNLCVIFNLEAMKMKLIFSLKALSFFKQPILDIQPFGIPVDVDIVYHLD